MCLPYTCLAAASKAGVITERLGCSQRRFIIAVTHGCSRIHPRSHGSAFSEHRAHFFAMTNRGWRLAVHTYSPAWPAAFVRPEAIRVRRPQLIDGRKIAIATAAGFPGPFPVASRSRQRCTCLVLAQARGTVVVRTCNRRSGWVDCGARPTNDVESRRLRTYAASGRVIIPHFAGCPVPRCTGEKRMDEIDNASPSQGSQVQAASIWQRLATDQPVTS
ncbi:hypothetical protein L1887_54933 [Cichorium endivia]|nr:hypothetical protein L1887_54933 [Cichorium endivia]